MIKEIKKSIKNFFEKRKPDDALSKIELERKAVQGAKQVVKEYPGVFERLAKYDRV